MSVECTANGTEILTTGFHLARDISYAIHYAFLAHLAFDHGNAETELHVAWSRS